jgi:hypothetical protein
MRMVWTALVSTLLKAPKGALALCLKPATAAGLDDLDKIMQPNALTIIFGFTASYPGACAGAARSGSKEK